MLTKKGSRPYGVLHFFCWDPHLDEGLAPEELVLRLDSSRAQEHVDHDVVQVGRGAADPLDDDEQGQVAEEGAQEDHLGDELEPAVRA